MNTACVFIFNTVRGDGSKYRARGLTLILGRTNYKACGDALGLDLINQPTYLEQVQYTAMSAAWFWSTRGLNTLADHGAFVTITRCINGGLNGQDDRQALYDKALKAAAMTPLQKLLGLGLRAILLLLLGTVGAVWLTSRDFRLLLDAANDDLVSIQAARDNLEALVGEQGRTLGELVQAGEMRERNVALAQDKVDQEAQPISYYGSEPVAILPGLLRRSLIRSWAYEISVDGAGSGVGGLRGKGARGASCAGRRASVGSMQDEDSGGSVLGSAWSEEVRQSGTEGAGAVGYERQLVAAVVACR